MPRGSEYRPKPHAGLSGASSCLGCVERITALEAELRAEQQRSGDSWTNLERERNRADHERDRADQLIELRDQLVVELEGLRTLLEEASGPVAEREWRWWPRRAG